MTNAAISYLSVSDSPTEVTPAVLISQLEITKAQPQIYISQVEIQPNGVLARTGRSIKYAAYVVGRAIGKVTGTSFMNNVQISYVAVESPPPATALGRSIKAIASFFGRALGAVAKPAAGPTVSIYPSNGSSVRGAKVTISASVVDSYYSVTKVEIYIDNILKVVDPSPPYQYTWQLKQYSKGNHTIKVIAYNNGGYSTTATSTVRIA